MSELQSFNSERIYWAVEQVEREAGDIDNLHLDDNLFYLKSKADKVIAELKNKCNMHDFFWDGCGFAKRGFKNTIAVSEAFDSLDAENRVLKRALWLARAARAHNSQHWSTYIEYVHFHANSFYEFNGDAILKRDNRNNDSFRVWYRKWAAVERKCRAKAEEYK